MRQAFFTPALVIPLALGAVSQAHAQERPIRYLAEALFDLAESHYPELFTSSESTVVMDEPDAFKKHGWQWRWFYRYYPQSNTYLAVNEFDQSIYVFGPAFGPDVTKAGWLDEVLRWFPPGLIKSGSDECVEIGSPTPDTTAYYGGGRWDQVVSWQPGPNGGIEVLRHAGRYYPRQHLFTETESVTSNAGLSYREAWSRTYIRQEHASESVWKQESETALYDSPGLLLGPTDRYCVGQAWLSASVTGTSTSTYFPASVAGPMPALSAQWKTEITASYVVSINTPIQVQAGEFVTVELVTNGQKRWIDVETGIPVKGIEILNDPDDWDWDSGYVNTFELYALEYSGQCPVKICGGN